MTRDNDNIETAQTDLIQTSSGLTVSVKYRRDKS